MTQGNDCASGFVVGIEETGQPPGGWVHGSRNRRAVPSGVPAGALMGLLLRFVVGFAFPVPVIGVGEFLCGLLSRRQLALHRGAVSRPEEFGFGPGHSVGGLVVAGDRVPRRVVCRHLFGCQREQTFPYPRLCIAIVDRVTFNAQIVETGTDSFRFAQAQKKRKR
ncbi:hypothetical protein [Streptomyces niveus]|uniref:hypothetical protein n=1 Tax=Streptomyces niveus TaxID=193462 RepID=UPI0036495B6B